MVPGDRRLAVGVVGTYSRESANRVVNRADLVCFLGSETGGMTTHFWAVPPIGTPTVQVDINPEALGRNYPFRAAINADIKATLAKMLPLVDRSSAAKRQPWLAETRRICAEWAAKYRPYLTSDAVPIRPERLCAELTRHVPDDAVVVADTGHAGMWMSHMFDIRTAAQTYLRCAGHLGWAFCAGLGAKCALPDRPVVAFTGDAGFWYHIAEIESAVRWNIASVTVVNNNGAGSQSKRGFDKVYEAPDDDRRRELWTYSKMNFARIAEDIGALGIRVETAGEFPSALARAIASKRPAIIDVATDVEALAPLAVS
jgi:acetolactate synthase I/II/III large subunit